MLGNISNINSTTSKSLQKDYMTFKKAITYQNWQGLKNFFFLNLCLSPKHKGQIQTTNRFILYDTTLSTFHNHQLKTPMYKCKKIYNQY